MTPNFIITSPLTATSYLMEDITELTLGELCRACGAQVDIIIELISEGVIEIRSIDQSLSQEYWRFSGVHLHRAKVAMRLHRDLGVNFAGAALALQLMDDLDQLKSKLSRFAR